MGRTDGDRLDAPADEAAAGPRVFGSRYAVERELGRGGMGRVYRARDVKIDRAVAIKVLAPGGNPARFEQEARAAGALSHPNVIAVYDVGEDGGEPYLVTELLEGQPLREVLRDGPLAAEEAGAFALQIAHGLAAAHRKGIVHRDLKPENIFVTDDGTVKILDFGIARLTQGAKVKTLTGAAVGTPAYMSPEQVQTRPVDARSDVFSFGAVLYEMLSGRSPFEQTTMLETAYSVVHDEPPALAPSRFSDIVARCLAKDPALRFSDAGKLVDALSPGRSAVSWERVALIAVLVLASSLLALAAIPRLQRRAPVPTDPGVIAVFPFAVRGTGQSAYLSDGMVDLLSTTLSGRSLRTVDPHALLARVSREKWTLEPQRARELAAAMGARRYVLGTVLEVGPRLRILASIYDADGTAPLREVKVEGESTGIFELVDDLSMKIGDEAAPPAAGQRFARLAEVTTSSRVALGAYLDALAAKRAGRFAEAQAAAERAVAADPSFALAQYTVAWTAWEQHGSRNRTARAAARLAVAMRSKLPEQDRSRVDAFAAFVTRSDGCQAAHDLATDIVSAHPDDGDTWLLLGEIDVHCGHRIGLLPSAARVPLQKAMEAGPHHAEALLHLLQIDLLEGDVESLVRRVPPLESVSTAVADWPWIAALVRHDLRAPPAGVNWGLFWEAMRVPGAMAAVRALADRAEEPFPALNLRAALALQTGHLREARSRIEAIATASRNPRVRAFWWTVAQFEEPDLLAIENDRRILERAPDVSAGVRSAWTGSLAALARDEAGAARNVAELEAMPEAMEGSTTHHDLALWIRALQAWKAGRAEQALVAVRSIRGDGPPDGPDWGFFDWTAVEYFEGELLFALGRYDDAEARLRSVADWYLADWFYARRLRLLGEIEELRGNGARAVPYYRRFVELRSDPDPELRAETDGVRARLLRLE